MDELNQLTLKNTKTFSFNGLDIFAKVGRVHDADTLTILFKYNNQAFKHNIRLLGVDAPEMNSKVDAEKKVAQLGQIFLSDLILNKIIRVKMTDFDQYGRSLCYIYLLDSETTINSLLVEQGYVRPYGLDGNLHKEPWTDEDLNKIKK